MNVTKPKQRTSTDFLALTISAGAGKEEFTERDHSFGKNFRYRVQVRSDATRLTMSFDFHDSIDRHDKGIDQLDRENLLYAFWSFVSDAESGRMNWQEFASEFGYDQDSISARRTWAACKGARRKFANLFHDDREPSWVLEMLAAEGIE